MDARAKELDLAKKEAIFPGNLLDPGTQTLGQYLGGFYKVIKNKNELPRAEGFDMDPQRMRNFGLTAAPILDQSARLSTIDTKFSTTPASSFILSSVPSTVSSNDKKPYDIKVGIAPNERTLQIPLWDPAELTDSA